MHRFNTMLSLQMTLCILCLSTCRSLTALYVLLGMLDKYDRNIFIFSTLYRIAYRPGPLASSLLSHMYPAGILHMCDRRSQHTTKYRIICGGRLNHLQARRVPDHDHWFEAFTYSFSSYNTDWHDVSGPLVSSPVLFVPLDHYTFRIRA